MVRVNVTERSKAFAGCFIDWMFCTEHDDVWFDSQFLKLFYRMLSWLCLKFIGSFNVWHKSKVNVTAVFFANLVFNLADSFYEWKRFNITDSTTDFCDDYVCFCFFCRKKHAAFDFFCDVRNYLNCTSVEFSFAFHVKNCKVNAACSCI